MKLFENEYVTLSIDENIPCLEWIGKKYMPSEAFKESEEKSLELYLKYKDRHPGMQWFIDASEVGPVSLQDTEWVIENILPQFAAAGLIKEAFVMPTRAIGKITVDNYRSDAGETIEIELFDTTEAAKDWLKS
ncbi:hypothetical protein CSA56_10535 [candidate division KSB3 bacterium]|uniref:STAS/SEC14 domain-containing protein n=1 Tax=candidate division KSB3 bacterium TaxID=2044937 RepID=A0A2G6KDJ7_9BACT|nr:MAG: hypothetical protein CSA56_10535 [candidate division KSB3 bacterium]